MYIFTTKHQSHKNMPNYPTYVAHIDLHNFTHLHRATVFSSIQNSMKELQMFRSLWVFVWLERV